MDDSRAYTLIELMVVMAITSILFTVGYVNYRSFSSNQIAAKAAGQIQDYLRLAQANATSSTNCNGAQAADWSVVLNQSSIELRCNAQSFLLKSYTLENATAVYSNQGSCSSPIIITYSVGSGIPLLPCPTGPDPIFIISNTVNPNAANKTLTITSGGVVNVQ